MDEASQFMASVGATTDNPDTNIPQTSDSGGQFLAAVGARPDTALSDSRSSDTIALIHEYFPPHEWDNAIRVMHAESGGNPHAIGDNYPINGQTIPSYGLFQIRGLPGRPAPEQLLNPDFNVQYAARMQAQQGWGPWTTAHKLGIVRSN